ncbi:MAG: IS3 family transposase, partial [Planctomycetes bacterium]|nr:IS3 family transposase [Planctomycetota bacterium]
MAEPVRRHEGAGHEAPEGTRAGECAVEEGGGGAGARQGAAEGTRAGKLLSPVRRRRATVHLQEHGLVSERRACRATGQPRSTQRYPQHPVNDEARRLTDLKRLSAKHPRFGSPRIGDLLRREGWDVNHKRVERLWRREGLASAATAAKAASALHVNHVWTYDFVMDRTEDGRWLKLLTVVDEYTRECLAIEVARSLTARDVIGVLARLFGERGAPKYVRSDNGPEFIAAAVRRWLTAAGSATLFIAPGSPWENAYIESFNGKLPD